MLFGKNITQIHFNDIERLITNKVPEGISIEYKSKLDITTGDQRKEFLYDITAFANSDGGVVLFGIKEEVDEKGQNTGFPDQIVGISIDNEDSLLKQIEDVIQSSTNPSLTAFDIKIIDGSGVKILAIEIYQNLGLPIMVTYRGTNKFYKRRITGKYPVDVYELNQLFMRANRIHGELDNIRNSRVNLIKQEGFLPGIHDTEFALIHIIPVNHYLQNKILPFDKQQIIELLADNLEPVGGRTHDRRRNFEGFLITDYDPAFKTIPSYVQVFRNGMIEFYTKTFHSIDGDRRIFFIGMMEIQIIEAIRSSMVIYGELTISPPFIVFLSLVGMKNFKLYLPAIHPYSQPKPFISEDLLLPNIMIDKLLTESNQVIENELKTIFDIVWQSANCRRSPNYNEIGERIKY